MKTGIQKTRKSTGFLFPDRVEVKLGGNNTYNYGTVLSKSPELIKNLRFFEKHLIRDDQDLIRHVEYIHYNPVKHGLVKGPTNWEYTSFHRYMREDFLSSGMESGR